MNRRDFLIGIFGTAAVAAAGTIVEIIEKLPEKQYIDWAKALPRMDEIYGDDKGNYGFATIDFINEPPYFKLHIPKGFRPLREESDRINAMVMAQLKGGRS